MKRFSLLLLVVLFLSGCSNSQKSTELFQELESASSQDQNLDLFDSVSVNDLEFDRLTLLQESIIKDGNMPDCEQLNNQNFIAGCKSAIIKNQAITSRSLELCSSLESQADRMLCEFEVKSKIDLD
jgi:PBP1b-binding outer membrane lipoprotein LpoB